MKIKTYMIFAIKLYILEKKSKFPSFKNYKFKKTFEEFDNVISQNIERTFEKFDTIYLKFLILFFFIQF